MERGFVFAQQCCGDPRRSMMQVNLTLFLLGLAVVVGACALMLVLTEQDEPGGPRTIQDK
jgi:hypothetical protein